MSTDSERRLGLGVIGCGYWGPYYVRNALENSRMRLVAIADLRQERLDAIAARAPGARVTTSQEELLEDPAIEAVAIATPVSTHYALARQALEAGKHVILAKPMTATSREAMELIALAEERERVLLVDHTFVYTGAVRHIRRMLEDGALGDLYYVDSVRINLGLFQHDVNVIWDLAAHDFSILHHLLGRSPLAVSAIGASHAPDRLENIAYVHLEYENDLIAHLHVNWLSPVKIRRTVIGGSERMVVWDDLAADEKLRVYDRGITVAPSEEDLHKTIVSYRTGDALIPALERHEALALEFDHFVDCVEGKAVPLTGGEAGLHVVELLEATTTALETRAAVEVGTRA